MSKEACLIIPTQRSSATTWIQWHKSLKKCVGKSNANQLWMLNFEKEVPDTTLEMREYMRGQGVDLDRDVADRLTDFGSGVYNWFGGAFDVASYTTIALLIVIVGGLGMMIYNIAKTTDADKAIRVGTALGTRGVSEIGGGATKQIQG